MEISIPNENGVVTDGHREIVASLGRAYAAIEIAHFEDGLYRFSTSLQYSYGGFGGPIFADDEGYATFALARIAGLEQLLQRWHKPFPSEPQSVHVELRIMREQIGAQLCQPTLF
jgi:hypothetical protein